MADTFTITGWTKLGGLVRDARLARGLSQANLAAQAGVARSWLARVEAGHRGAELEQLFRLLEALDLTLTLHASEGHTGRNTKAMNRSEAPHTAGPTSSDTTGAASPGGAVIAPVHLFLSHVGGGGPLGDEESYLQVELTLSDWETFEDEVRETVYFVGDVS